MLLSKIKVVGYSMQPALRHNQIVIASTIPFIFQKPKVGDIVILQQDQCIIKRIAEVRENMIFIVGDNKKESTDSRNFGWISRGQILGKVILKI